jgi:predicted DNA-binding transcriptional regulator AlpA
MFNNSIPETGFIRLPAVLSLIPVSKTTWWQGCKSGRFPAPVKLGPRTTCWKVTEIRALIAKLAGGAHDAV